MTDPAKQETKHSPLFPSKSASSQTRIDCLLPLDEAARMSPAALVKIKYIISPQSQEVASRAPSFLLRSPTDGINHGYYRLTVTGSASRGGAVILSVRSESNHVMS